MDFKIEKNIPFPLGPSMSEYKKWAEVAAEMEIGDSVLVETANQLQSLSDALHALQRKVRTHIRQTDAVRFKIRVWRIEK